MYDTLRDNISLEEKLLLKKIAFENYILYLLLSPYFMDEVNLLNIANVYYRKDLEINMLLDELVKGFLGNEIISLHSAELFHKVGGYEPFRKDITEESELHFKELQRGIIQHDLKVVELYYTRITLKRLATLINVTTDIIETEISSMVYEGLLRAKIDRITGIVDFRKQKQQTNIMNDWSRDIRTLLELVESTYHLINREHLIHT